jgi:hypothetical protein
MSENKETTYPFTSEQLSTFVRGTHRVYLELKRANSGKDASGIKNYLFNLAAFLESKKIDSSILITDTILGRIYDLDNPTDKELSEIATEIYFMKNKDSQ